MQMKKYLLIDVVIHNVLTDQNPSEEYWRKSLAKFLNMSVSLNDDK